MGIVWILPTATVLCLLASVSVYLVVLVHDYVPVPYMDEEFHVRQARQYCGGNFKHWDPKITTPPGLYVLSVGLRGPLSSFIRGLQCSVLFLRSINVLFAIGNLYLFYAITQKLNNVKGFCLWRCALTALNLSIFPTLYFFTFLYYTDPGSVFFVLLAYLFSLHGSHWVAAVVGAVSLLFRQTNIVWVGFFALIAVKKILEKNATKELKRVEHFSLKYVTTLLSLGMDVVLNRRKQSAAILKIVAHDCFLYIVVGIGFVAFAVINGGIVLGDRSAHVITVHVPQLFYFAAFSLAFATPATLMNRSILEPIRASFRGNRILVTCGVTAFVALVVAFNTRAHPYLLADNRHYPFYVWRKFLGRHPSLKFAAIPVYLVGGLHVIRELTVHRDVVWCLVYVLCVAANLVTHELLEFRYFIVPYLMFRLQVPLTQRSPSTFGLALELLMHVMVNAITLFIFLERPFVWPDRDVLQRFMW